MDNEEKLPVLEDGDEMIDLEDDEDIIVFQDDEGNEITVRVLDYFFYNGQEYAVLTENIDADDEEEELEVFINQVVQIDDDMEEFIPVEEALMETLLKVAMTRFDAIEEA